MRARCAVAPVDPATAVCRVLGRYKLFVDTRDIGVVPHLMLDGYWELWITEFILRNLRPGQVALDLGAHVGYYTVLMADVVGCNGRVHAFEPNPRLNSLLRQNVSVNGFWRMVETHAVAVGDRKADNVPFLAETADPKNGRMLSGDASSLEPFEGPRYERTMVPMRSLDEAVQAPADLVKIDVEGAEELVWSGMQRLIDHSPDIMIVLEFNPRRCREPARTLGAIAERFPLRRIGFDGLATPCTAEEVLRETEDTILVLSRRQPD